MGPGTLTHPCVRLSLSCSRDAHSEREHTAKATTRYAFGHAHLPLRIVAALNPADPPGSAANLPPVSEGAGHGGPLQPVSSGTGNGGAVRAVSEGAKVKVPRYREVERGWYRR